MGRILKSMKIAAVPVALAAGAAAQVVPDADLSRAQQRIEQAQRAIDRVPQQLDMRKVQEQIEMAQRAMQLDQVQKVIGQRDLVETEKQLEQAQRALVQAQGQFDRGDIQEQMLQAQRQMELAAPFLRDSFSGNLLTFPRLEGMLAYVPQSDAAERARELADRQRELRDRQREQADRVRENEDRKIELYSEGKESIDEGRYDQAVSRFNRLLDLDSKWSRVDGVYYWKAYALNRQGKRDEALATVGEIAKQFPKSNWVNDAKALQVEIQQAAGHPVSPDSINDQDLRLLAMNSLMNSDSATAVPLVEKVLNDPKNNLALKSKALFVLAQSRTDKAREIVTAYAKNGSNPDLQIKAVQYLGTYRSKDSTQALADIYAANPNVDVRRAVLRSMMIARDTPHLFNAAKSEQNVDLRRDAIRQLGAMQASSELAQLYASETNTELKASILQSLMASRGGDKLLDIAKNEKNAELRGDAIRYLGAMRNEKSGDALASLYANESDKNVKFQIIRTLGSQGQGKQLVEITRNEKDGELKREGVQWLGRMKGSKEATDYLMELISK